MVMKISSLNSISIKLKFSWSHKCSAHFCRPLLRLHVGLALFPSVVNSLPIPLNFHSPEGYHFNYIIYADYAISCSMSV